MKRPITIVPLIIFALGITGCAAGKTNEKARTFPDAPHIGDIVVSDPAAIYPLILPRRKSPDLPSRKNSDETLSVYMNFSITNQNPATPDRLIDIIALNGTGKVKLESLADIKPGHSLYSPVSRIAKLSKEQIRDDHLDAVNAILTDKISTLKPGLAIALKFRFQVNGDLIIHVPVRENADEYHKYTQAEYGIKSAK